MIYTKTTTDTNTSTSSCTPPCPYLKPKAEQGWECPRCGRINAPWTRQCDCSRSNWTITSDWTYKPDWWKEITCNGTSAQAQIDSDTFKVHPDSTVYQVGGSDYKEGHVYVNVGGTQSNKVDPNVSASWSPDISTNTIHTEKTNYKE